MKKRLVVLVLIFSFLLTSGCYVTKAAKIKDIVGTYKLVTYNYDNKDLLTERNMEAYLVINNGGSSYYVLKQGDYPITVQEVELRFIPDEEETDKYSYIEYRFAYTTEYQKLGISGKILNENLIRYKLVGKELQSYNVTTSMERISRKTDLSTVKEKLGELPPAMNLEQAKYDGVYTYQYDDGLENLNAVQNAAMNEGYTFPYVYYIIDVDMAHGKATSYYMLKSDEVAHVEESSFTYASGTPFGSLNGLTLLPVNSNGNAMLETLTYSGDVNAYLKLPVKLTLNEVDIEFNYEFTKTLRHQYDLQYQMDYFVQSFNESKPQTDAGITE